MAEKDEEEIKTNNDKKEELKLLIIQKSENDLSQVKLNLIKLIKEKNGFYDSYLILFVPLLDNAEESMEKAKKEKTDTLKSIKEEIDKIEKDKVESIYKDAAKDLEEKKII
jgi:methanogenic corrinoid protein MtbC1